MVTECGCGGRGGTTLFPEWHTLSDILSASTLERPFSLIEPRLPSAKFGEAAAKSPPTATRRRHPTPNRALPIARWWPGSPHGIAQGDFEHEGGARVVRCLMGETATELPRQPLAERQPQADSRRRLCSFLIGLGERLE